MTLIRRLRSGTDGDPVQHLVDREWLVTNGLGGYASGSIAGVITRRYHGVLIAALPGPFGRVVMLSHLSEDVVWPDGKRCRLTATEHTAGITEFHAASGLKEFRVEDGLPIWRYEFSGVGLEKRLLMPHQQNTVHVAYRLTAGEPAVRLELRPSMNFRSHDAPVNEPLGEPYVLTAVENRYEVTAPHLPVLRLVLHGPNAAFVVEALRVSQVLYRVEQARGYESTGDLWSPGYFAIQLPRDEPVTMIASTEAWDTMLALTPAEAWAAERQRRGRLLASANGTAREGIGGELILAADQFIVQPAGRAPEAARAHAAGDEVRTVVAGYHWFTDWGRDTMISLEGLTLVTGRQHQAGNILRTFARYMRDGLIPNLFPEGQREGLYHTADATLWFFHAIARYLDATGDRETLRILLPRLRESVEWHVRGTRFGIQVDPVDGLLRQGAEGYQLTWMDAKVDDWVVTPRRGKAIEINALWYNALRLLEGWLREEQGEATARPVAERAARTRQSFNERFWYEQGGYLYDVVDGPKGNDTCCRPNQLLAIALPHAVLDPARWAAVVDLVQRRLLTPVGLRSLAPGEPDYKAQYYGDLRSRDAAYHQGTVWAWLIGPFIDAWLRVHPGEEAEARHFLDGFAEVLGEACVGTIAEIFDAQAPFTPRGCVAQAWSVAEVLRCWVKTAGGGSAKGPTDDGRLTTGD
jgi:predicted glycogen debranching enzyme